MRIAETAAASVIAPVPCRSSLKVRSWPRYFSRMRRAVAGPKIFPLQQSVGKQLRGGLDVGVDEGIVAFSADAGMPVPGVHRIGQQAFPIGAHIEHHRNHARRVNPARRCIDRQFADGDFDSADAPIADAEDLLGIRGQDQVDIVRTGPQVSERFLDRIGMIDRKVHAPGTPALVVILLHRQAHRPIVDDRNHLAQVFGEHAEEQYFIAVVERGQIDNTDVTEKIEIGRRVRIASRHRDGTNSGMIMTRPARASTPSKSRALKPAP